jgi:uncharacterized protein YbjT (DUF2867 family)
MKTALVVGGSGLVGNYLIEALLHDNRYRKIISLGRSELPIQNDKLEQKVVDFDNLELSGFEVDDVFSCLGTTINKAGSKENFRKVDFTYPVNVAEWSISHGASQFILNSSMGADESSTIFYNQVKGEVEKVIASLGFKAFYIVRPSLLLGPRKEFRFGETVGKFFMSGLGFLFVGGFKKYKAIHAKTVAHAMVAAATQEKKGVFVYESDALEGLSS